MMQFSIVYVAFALVMGFVFGFAISFLADKAMMAKWRKDAVFAKFCVTTLVAACRDVLSDAWYKRVMKAYRAKIEGAQMSSKVTNEQKYETAEKRNEAFAKYCGSRLCQECKLHDKRDKELTCAFNWLALEAEEEKPEPCPFCGGKCVCANEWNGKFRVVCHEKENCWYSSSLYDTRYEAIAAHNRVARAVRAAKESEAE